MENKQPRKPITPYSPKWEEFANALARNTAPTLYPCQKCNYPVLNGYCCTFCGDSDPSTSKNGARFIIDN